MTSEQITELQRQAGALADRLRSQGDPEGAQLVVELRQAAYRGWNILDQLGQFAQKGMTKIGGQGVD
jgi:hypothetical protein